MPNVFLTSDTHFGHLGVCKFLKEDGSKLRPWDHPDEMDEELVKRWNDVVRPNDKVYHLGDVVLNRKALKTVARLNGDKVLIKGNHDIFKLEEYTPYFRDIRGYHVLNGMVLSHIPMHRESISRFGSNIHGHLHANRVTKPIGVDHDTGLVLYGNEIDPYYFCVSVEHTNYTPISLDEVSDRITNQGGVVGFLTLSTTTWK